MKSALRRKIKAGVNYCIPIHMCSANLLPHSLNAVAHNSICLFWAVRRFHWPITHIESMVPRRSKRFHNAVRCCCSLSTVYN
jgi:hypothetical protein